VIYDIKLRLSYKYSGLAATGRHLACLMPREIAGRQRLVAGLVEIEPRPDERFDRQDFYGNRAVEFALRSPHAGIAVILQARVERTEPAVNDPPSPSLAGLRAEVEEIRDLGPESPVHFLAPSPRVPGDPAMTAFARAQLRPGMEVAAVVQAISKALYEEMTFDPKATTVDTPAAEAFANRHGVCQDFSHILISCLRGVGVPAGYVSGFLRTLPPPGKPRLEGADAMHAWVRAWCGASMGWIEVDPTNDCRAGADHIIVARGRDYSDVAPIKGVMRVAGDQTIRQAVDVLPVG
jgi:transglutaminase-like putative cysteine protease